MILVWKEKDNYWWLTVSPAITTQTTTIDYTPQLNVVDNDTG